MKTQIIVSWIGLIAAAASASAQVPFYSRTAFLAAAPEATNVIDFQEFNLETGQGTGFLPPFTELGFVRFDTNANFSQEVIEGSNVGQPGNNVYTTLAADLNLTIADITFGRGVPAVGFDLKDTGNASSTSGSVQTFFATFFACTNNLGTFPVVAPAGGTTFQFFGLTSSNLVTEIQFSSVSGTPNLQLVLDNFAVASRPTSSPITLDIRRDSSGVVLTWANNCAFGLQAAPTLQGPYNEVPGATSPYTNSPSAAVQFFRLQGK